jgi:hypothetical protein
MREARRWETDNLGLLIALPQQYRLAEERLGLKRADLGFGHRTAL